MTEVNDKEVIIDFGPLEIGQFLKDRKIDSEDVDSLVKEKYNGHNFSTWDMEQYVLLDMLGKATIVAILQLKQSVFGGDVQSGGAKKKDLQKRKKNKRKTVFARPRRFDFAVDKDFHYSSGTCLPHETGIGSLDEPAREFKLMDLAEVASNKRDLVKAFVTRVGKFVVGCMNQRCNGTLYFGVADSKRGGCEHGEVVGMALTPNLRDKLEEVMTSYFVGKDPLFFKGVEAEIKSAVQNCVRALKFVPVRGGGGGNEDRVVMELDVRPASSVCGNQIYYVIEESAGEKHRVYFLREGTSTNKYTRDDGAERLRTAVTMAVKRREEQEGSSKLQDKSFNSVMTRLLCRNRSSQLINDEEFRFVLVSCVEDPGHADHAWMAALNWFLILDLHSESGIANQFTDCVDIPSCIGAAKLTEILEQDSTQRDFLRTTDIGNRTLIVGCGDGNADHWFDAEFKGISELILQAFDKKRLDNVRPSIIIVMLDGESRLERVSKVLVTMRQRISADQFVFFAEKKATLQKFESRMEPEGVMGSNIGQLMHPTQFSDLNRFVSEKTRKFSTFSGLKLACRGGRTIDIDYEDVEFYKQKKVFLLAANECEEVKGMSREENKAYCEKGNDMIRDFLKGGTPEWRVFYLSALGQTPIINDVTLGLVTRDRTQAIVSKLQEKEDDPDAPYVVRQRIVHQAGAGATTIARHVLWELRKAMRCVVLDGLNFLNGKDIVENKLEETASCILKLRGFQERPETVKEETEENMCTTVLVLLDNSSDVMAKHLSKKIEDMVDKRNIKLKHTMVILLYLVSSFDLDIPFEEILAGDTESSLDTEKIEHKLSANEKTLFETRLRDLVKKEVPEDMLSFVIMAQDFDKKSEYVQKVVRNSLRDMDRLYPLERQLLLYLSVLKYYGNACLTSKTCFHIAFSGLWHYKHCWASLTSQSRTFLRQRKINDPGAVGECQVMEVVHIPVAYQLIKEILEQQELELEDVIVEMLDSEELMTERFMHYNMHLTMRKLLVKRTRDDVEQDAQQAKKRKFSKLILDICKKTGGITSAASILEKGYRTLGEVNKAFVAQTLSRLYYVDIVAGEEEEAFDMARKWALRASRRAPHLYVFYDTLGQLHLKELRYYMELQRDDPFHLHQCERVVRLAKLTAGYFLEEQRLYLEAKKKPQTSVGLNELYSEINLCSINPGLFGEVSTYLELVSHLVASVELENRDERRKFLLILKKESNQDLRPLFGTGNDDDDDYTWQWNDVLGFLLELQTNSERCLKAVTTKLGYVSMQATGMQKHWIIELDNHVQIFQRHFGTFSEHWRRDYDTKKMETIDQKMAFLRSYLRTCFTNSLAWLIRDASTAQHLYQLQDILVLMEELSTSKKKKKIEIGMMESDKVSYMNVAFALVFKQADRIRLKYKTVKKFCLELASSSDDIQQPEPYLFYLMLYWPSSYEADNLEKLNACKKQLRALEASMAVPYYEFLMLGKLSTLFYLMGSSATASFDKFTSRKRAATATAG